MSLLFRSLQNLDGDRDIVVSLPTLEADEFLRCAKLKAASKLDAALAAPNEEGSRPPAASEPRPRAFEWPQPARNLSPASLPTPIDDRAELSTASAPATLASSEESPLKLSAGVKRAVSALRAALPFVQTILLLLEGSIRTTASTDLTTAHIHAIPAPSLQKPDDSASMELACIESSLAEFKTEYRELSDQIVGQTFSLKRVGDQLESVREATDRNTREQHELIEQLRGVCNKISVVALVAFGLLGVSVVIDIIVYLHVS